MRVLVSTHRKHPKMSEHTLIQVFSIVFSTAGLAVEMYYHADFGFALITGGSILYAISEKIARYSERKKEEKKK